MNTLLMRLDLKLSEWQPEVADLVKERISEIMDLADENILDIQRSRTLEQEVLDPSEVWLADLGFAAKTRPVVVVSRYDPNAPRALVIYVPLTTQNRGSLYEVEIPKLKFLDKISVANIQGLGTIPNIRLERKLGQLPSNTMLQIKQAIIFALELDTSISDS
jgi:mRNA interferase MazF